MTHRSGSVELEVGNVARPEDSDWYPARRSPARHFLRICRKNPIGAVAALFLFVEVLLALFAGFVATESPVKTDLFSRLHGPSGDHWFGTDSVGRDQWARVLYGTRASLLIAAMATIAGVVPGVVIGMVTGFFGGWIDLVVQRLIDTIQAFPALIMAMLIVSILGPGAKLGLGIFSIDSIILPMAFIFCPGVSRVVRASVLSLRNRDFILASNAVGATPLRIMVRHMLPNVLAPIMVMASLLFGAAILVEAGLSFLGLGVQPPHPSLGGILSKEGRPNLALHPYLTVIPALVISLTVLAVNLIGDTLRDLLDPNLRKRL